MFRRYLQLISLRRFTFLASNLLGNTILMISHQSVTYIWF